MKTLKQFCYLARPFWGVGSAWFAWLLLAVVLVLSLSSVWFNVRLNQWNGDFYNALQQLNSQALYQLLQHFIVLVSALILVVVFADYLKQRLIMRWRIGMTEYILARWLSRDGQHYALKINALEPDNPDQRIAEDVRLLIESSLRLLITFLHSMLTLVSFAAILWQLSGSLNFSLSSHSFTIPGYMFWVCIFYTLIGIGLTHWIGYPLRQLNMEKQRREADYRSGLIARREASDAIAGQRGELHERAALLQHFRAIADNWYQLIRYEKNLSFFTVGYQQVSALAPIFFALPKFLAGELLLGGLMQIRQSFAQVAGALGWFIFSYRDIAAWQATVTRLYNFVVLLEAEPSSPVETASDDAMPLRARLNLQTADGNSLLRGIIVEAVPGSLTLIQGRSGIGKSTLLRAFSGHWPHYRGQITRSASVHWLPQRLYLAHERLDDLLAYPAERSAFSDEQYRDVLTQVGLPQLVYQLPLSTAWQQRLSGGEQQRLMFARLLLNKPRLILLDETTSALDASSARHLLRLLRSELPCSAILLVSHQTFLADLADHRLYLDGQSFVSQGVATPCLTD
ncbi:putative membrane transport ATP-binding protein [Yersinia nurmii]|uniref:Membrane transport ATP-binding protein n=1 Tax=Yersinia nurmii TaxID=685706 RepID=A0ABP1YI35_9GAMM|nr:ABC transporter ATP-binding protein/permease [Yersinia nurmii]CNE75544.1 putative membrane transport ATP-binding protein [Yersinia nurmii]